MSHAPKLTGTGCVVGMSETHVEIDRASISTTEWHQGYFDLLHVAGGVRITIEPAEDDNDAAAAPGDALDYLGQLTAILAGLAEVHDDQSHEHNARAIRRSLQLANTASNALLAERRAAR